jgi:rubrerythrin
MNALEKFAINLNRRWVRNVSNDVEALRWFLSMAADEESSGESAVFERIAGRLDGKLAKLVLRHAEDEVRHEQMLKAAIRTLGVEPVEIPEELRIVPYMAKAAGDVFEPLVLDDEGVAKAYLLLYAVERRAVERFTMMEEALRPVRPAIADVFARICEDERRHLLYCLAVSRAVVPDEAKWTQIRDRMIEVEAEVFTARTKKVMQHMLGVFGDNLPWTEKLFFRTARTLSDLTGRHQYVLDVGGAKEIATYRKAAALAA